MIDTRMYSPTFVATSKKRAVKRGSMNKVKTILIENISEKGLAGKVYNPLPTKNKSKYVPTKDAKRTAVIYALRLLFLSEEHRFFCSDGELDFLKCFTVFIMNVPSFVLFIFY